MMNCDQHSMDLNTSQSRDYKWLCLATLCRVSHSSSVCQFSVTVGKLWGYIQPTPLLEQCTYIHHLPTWCANLLKHGSITTLAKKTIIMQWQSRVLGWGCETDIFAEPFYRYFSQTLWHRFNDWIFCVLKNYWLYTWGFLLWMLL